MNSTLLKQVRPQQDDEKTVHDDKPGHALSEKKDIEDIAAVASESTIHYHILYLQEFLKAKFKNVV